MFGNILCLDEEAGGSGDDYLKVDSAWHGDIDSDADSVDSEEEDPLKWASKTLLILGEYFNYGMNMAFFCNPRNSHLEAYMYLILVPSVKQLNITLVFTPLR